jgi:hypothetical protein
VLLDIDGVLCTAKERGRGLNPQCVSNLNWLTARANADIVVSSTWRFMKDVDERLRTGGVRGKIIGCTPDLSRAKVIPSTSLETGTKIYLGATRGEEIQAWLDRHPKRPFVILDDDDDMGPLKPFLIQCTFEHGLTAPLAVMAYRQLTK